MFQIDWARKNKNISLEKDIINNELIKSEKIMFNEWEEHCFECAPPICYNTVNRQHKVDKI
jgi:hypothetical protein